MYSTIRVEWAVDHFGFILIDRLLTKTYAKTRKRFLHFRSQWPWPFGLKITTIHWHKGNFPENKLYITSQYTVTERQTDRQTNVTKFRWWNVLDDMSMRRKSIHFEEEMRENDSVHFRCRWPFGFNFAPLVTLVQQVFPISRTSAARDGQADDRQGATLNAAPREGHIIIQ